MRCELLFGSFALGLAWSCGRDEEALEVGAGEGRALAGLLVEILGQLRAGPEEGLVDLVVAGEMGGRRQGAGSFQAGCLVLSSWGVVARRLSSGPVGGAGTSEGSAFAWGWAGVGTALGR